MKLEYVLVLYDKLIYLNYGQNAVLKTIPFSDNIKQMSIFDDSIFACSDKRAFLFTKDFGKRPICSVLSGSQLIGVTIDRLLLIRSTIDQKGSQTIKVS